MVARDNRVVNFGCNLVMHPKFVESPGSEEEVLDLLRRHRGRTIRAMGSLHAWSALLACSEAAQDNVAVRLDRMQEVQIDSTSGIPVCRVGAGCLIERLVEELNRQGWTTPSIGLITQQTISGATSTATHGSGRHCLSHYIRAMRIATYDDDGEPVIRVIETPEQLNAARCGLGSFGIITSITLEIRQQYFVEEHFRVYDSLHEVMEQEAEYPLQQFYFVPWKWNFFVQHRRESSLERSKLAVLYRWYWLLAMDRGMHWVVLALARWLPNFATLAVFRWVLPNLVLRGWKVVDRSDRQLTMQHHLFRHIETEMFVQQSQLAPMLDFCRWLMKWSHGQEVALRDDWQGAVASCQLEGSLSELHRRYTHHYPICIRKVLPDNGLISMSGGGAEPWYAISFICYARPEQRDGFFRFSDALIRLSGELFAARPHWGKQTPLPPPNAIKLYPGLEEFMRIRDTVDPTKTFKPDWLQDSESIVPTTVERIDFSRS